MEHEDRKGDKPHIMATTVATITAQSHEDTETKEKTHQVSVTLGKMGQRACSRLCRVYDRAIWGGGREGRNEAFGAGFLEGITCPPFVGAAGLDRGSDGAPFLLQVEEKTFSTTTTTSGGQREQTVITQETKKQSRVLAASADGAEEGATPQVGLRSEVFIEFSFRLCGHAVGIPKLLPSGGRDP